MNRFKFSLLAALFLTLGIACSSTPRISSQPASVNPPAKIPKALVASTIPFTLHDNRILLKVQVNGQGPFTFIFDTGGVNTLSPNLKNKLKLASQGFEIDSSADHQLIRHTSVRVRQITIGSVELESQKFLVKDLTRIRRAFRFRELDGILGSELLLHQSVKIDFDRSEITLSDLDSPTQMAGAKTLRFEWLDQKPVVVGDVNGHPAKILVDTGDRSNLTLFRPFARTTTLNRLFLNRESMTTGYGLGGPIRGQIAYLQQVSLGDLSVHDVLGRLPQTKTGYFMRSDLSAVAGVGLLKGFNLEFNSKTQMLLIQPRVGFNEPSSFAPVPR